MFFPEIGIQETRLYFFEAPDLPSQVPCGISPTSAEIGSDIDWQAALKRLKFHSLVVVNFDLLVENYLQLLIDSL